MSRDAARSALAVTSALALCVACAGSRDDRGWVETSAEDELDAGARDAGARDASVDAASVPADYGARCFGFDPNVVWLMGEVFESPDTTHHHDFASLLSPAQHDVHCQNFETSSAPQVRPDGRLIYIANWWVSHRNELRLFVPDDLDPETGVRMRNADQVVPTPACDDPRAWGVASFVLDPRDGAAYYRCLYYDEEPDEHAQAFFDAEGNVFYDGPLIAINQRGHLLSGSLGGSELQVQPARRTVEPFDIAWPEELLGFTAVAVRSRSSGFWIALARDEASPDEPARREACLVFVSPTGAVEIVTHYPEPMEAFERGRMHAAALDAEGNLYEVWLGPRSVSMDQVVRRHRDGSPSEVLWDETEQPDGGLPLYVGDRSYFATGP